MTKAAAIYEFFSRFGIPAYTVEDVPDDAVFPWLTYEFAEGALGDVTAPAVELWYYGESNVPVNAKAQEIASACRRGASVTFDGGGAVIWCGPWSALRDEADDKIKRRRSSFTIDWISLY